MVALKIDPIFVAHATAVEKFVAAEPRPIANGYCDPDDINTRVDDMANITGAYIDLLMAYAGDLNYNLPVAQRVDLTEFKEIVEGTFGDLVFAFERRARMIGEDFGQPRRIAVQAITRN